MQFGSFNMDSWPWKIAVVAALIIVREFIRVLSPKDPKSEGSETSKWLIETLDSASIAIGLVLFIIQPFILQAFFIPSGSMEDTLRISDRLLVSKLVYRMKSPAFQDVIVFKAPKAALITNPDPNEDVDFIKRCMGVPGDVIEVKNRRVFRNGVEVPEPYTKWNDLSPSITNGSAPDERAPQQNVPRVSYDMKIVGGAVYSREYDQDGKPREWNKNNVLSPDQEQITDAKPGKVPPGNYLFLGDHRSNSNDGHFWGFTPRANLVGKAICVFWPPTRLGLVDHMSFNQHGGDK